MHKFALERTSISDLGELGTWGATFILGLAAALYGAISLGYEPFWVLLGALACFAALFVMSKWPMLLVAGLLFVGNFKDIPAQGISLTDPTMLLFLMCAGAIALQLLLAVSGTSDWTISRMLGGQLRNLVLFILFLTVLTVSYLYTPAPELGRMKLTRFMAFEVLAFVAPLVLLKDEKTLRQFVFVVIVLSIALLGKELAGIGPEPEHVAGADEVDVTRIGDGMQFSVAILALLYRKFSSSRLLVYGLLGALAVGLIASAARSPVLALLFTVVVSACVLNSKASFLGRTKLLSLFAGMIVIGALALVWVRTQPSMHEKVAAKEFEFQAFLSGQLVSGGTISQRLSFYHSSLDALARHPVLGLGLGGWSVFYSVQGSPTYPHNFFLEVAAEQGLTGLVVLLGLIGSLFLSASRFKDDPEVAFLLPVMIFLIACNSITGDIESRELWFWFGMVVAAGRLARERRLRRDPLATPALSSSYAY